ncbi:16S rRNA pseudouridine(516) synthase [Thiobacillus sedimenti]|uniref:Pseudouridine synthase n=1 Tax=Thiobacillus sedimenti TaxID=3110231 RepID=A0ABZ1CKZ1_9PROT|nr:16S rRNA pseudouridine(516) synthase [Thiobacillus sp. SCUT-2]WRS40051.1 16S rRNA pseudouridine(516) synthase [Thiobacillus sp. SCUT-2]
MKLYRILQSQGFGSRKGCMARVRAGAVAVNGAVCDDPEAEIDTTGLELTLDGAVWAYREKAYLMMHKPAGYECSHHPSHHPGVFSLLPAPLLQRGVQCVGRLDQDTTGLLLFSDDGQFIHRMIAPRKRIAKVYRARCAEPVTDAMLEALRAGVQLNDEPAPIAALACERLDAITLRLTLAEGKYHQVKRMIAAAGSRVEALHREAMGAFALPVDLAPGAWRWLEAADLQRLEQAWPSNPY